MAQEIRTVLRRLDEAIKEGNLDLVYKQAIKAISEFDKEREYDKSINILNKLNETEIIVKDRIKHEEFLSHSIIRYILNGQIDEAIKLRNSSEIELAVPTSEMVQLVLDYHINSTDAAYQVQSIEKLSLLGNYEPILDLPSVKFQSEDDVTRILEDYFTSGRYIVNLLETANMLIHSIKVDVGTTQEVNVVENRRIFKIK